MSVFDWIFEKRATIQSGGNPQSPQYWVQKMLGGGSETAAGVVVDSDTALSFSPFWAAVNIIAGAIGFLPLCVYRRLDPRGKEKATESPVYSLVHDRPNDYMDSLTFRETLQAHVLVWGNGYAEIEFNNAGRPRALWPLLPNNTKPEVIDGKLYYRTHIDGAEYTLPYWRVLHIKGLGADGLEGYSVLEKARESIGAGVAVDQFGAAYFGNGARFGGILEHPGKLDDEARKHLRESIQREHGGVSNAHRMMVLEEGMKYQALGTPPEDAQFLESRTYSVRDIARWFCIPAHMLVDNEHATFSNIEHQGIEFVTWTLARWLKRWELECSYKLFAEESRKTFFCEFIVNALMKGDIKSRYEAYNVGRNGGWLSVNDIRDLENMNPVEDGDGYLQPLNMIGLGEEPPEPKAPAGDSGRMRPLVEETWRRIVKREVGALRTALKHPETFREVVREFYEKHTTDAAGILQPVLVAICGESANAVPVAQRYVATASNRLNDALNRSNNGGMAAEIDAILSEWESKKAAELAEETLKGA